MPISPALDMKVADEAWVATALLQHELPKQSDFSIAQIRDRAEREGMVRPGVYVHLSTHCVANKPAQPANHRMLFETSHGRRRLFRDGDTWDETRTGKTTPRREELPEQYHWLLDWYGNWAHTTTHYRPRGVRPRGGRFAGLLGLQGTWTAGDPDKFVRKIRGDWR